MLSEAYRLGVEDGLTKLRGLYEHVLTAGRELKSRDHPGRSPEDLRRSVGA